MCPLEGKIPTYLNKSYILPESACSSSKMLEIGQTITALFLRPHLSNKIYDFI